MFAPTVLLECFVKQTTDAVGAEPGTSKAHGRPSRPLLSAALESCLKIEAGGLLHQLHACGPRQGAQVGSACLIRSPCLRRPAERPRRSPRFGSAIMSV